MYGLFLILALAGVLPAPGLLRTQLDAAPPSGGEALLLDVDLAARDEDGLDDLGRTLSRGLELGELRVGPEGTPGAPFLSNFFHEHELRFTRLDPEAALSSVMIQVRVDLD